MENEEIEKRIESLEEKVLKLAEAMDGVFEHLKSTVKMFEGIQEIHQNINSYLIVNVGPPLFIDEYGGH